MVSINYLSTHCTFIYLLLKILKLLPTKYKPGQRKHFRKLKFRKVNLFLRGNRIQVLSNWKENLFLYHQNTEKVVVVKGLWVCVQHIVVYPEYSQSIEIGKSDLVDIDCIDQSLEIDDTLLSFIYFACFVWRYVCSSVHPKRKTDFMQTVNLLTIDCCNWESKDQTIITVLKKSFKKIWKILSFIQNQV